mgnify:CR=1 FL=1
MKFQVPQFIEHEPKVIGPVTFKQAAYLGFPLAFIFLLYFMLAENLILFVALAIALEGTGAVFSFLTLSGKSVPRVLLEMLYFFMRPKKYIWMRGKHALRFRQMEYTNPSKQGLPKVELTQQSTVGNLAMRTQTKN